MVHKKTVGDVVFMGIVYLLMALFLLSVLYPFMNSLAISLNDSKDTMRGGISIIPRKFTLQNYSLILQNAKIYSAYYISISRTVLGTLTGVFFTSMLAYGLSNKKLMGRKFYTIICLVPMYFSGGIIPTYFLINSLGMINSFWVYIIPNLVGLWNMLLMRSFFQNIPEAIEESALLDGANYFQIYFYIIVPISGTIFATIALFTGVGQWNAWFDAAMYITRENLKPMQSVLLSIISEAKFAEKMTEAGASASQIGNMAQGRTVNVRSITMATMIITILPIIVTYPFLQKFFVKGVMIGSVKG